VEATAAAAAAAVAAALPSFRPRAEPPRAGRLAGSRPVAGVGRRGKGKREKGFRPTLGALGPEPSSGLQKDKYVPDMINTPLDPRPCKNTPSKSQRLCFSLGIAWVRGVAVDLRIERKRWGRKVLRKMSWGFGAKRSSVHGLCLMGQVRQSR